MSDAEWALAGVAIGGLLTGVINYCLQKSQFKHNKEMFLLQNQGKEVIKSLLNEMLSHKSYTDRSFEAIRKKVGGFTDNEIRQLLHEIGAKKVTRNDGEKEWWYLASREAERIEKRENRT